MDIKKIFKRSNVYKKAGLSAAPDFFWDILLIFAFTMMILAVFFGAYSFTKVDKTPIFEVGDRVGKVQIINKDRIDKVLQIYVDKDATTTQILTSPSAVVDPSL